MTRRVPPLVAVLALCVAALLAVGASPAAAADDYEVVYAQVVHRYGARNPELDTSDAAFLCGFEYPCGALTGTGREMMESLGSFLRQRYNNASVVDAPFFPATSYNVSLVSTRSTAAKRTLQSAQSVLLKLFPDAATFNPAVETVEAELDTFLDVNALPRAFVRLQADPELQEEAVAPVVDKYLTLTQLQAMAAEAHVSGSCESASSKAVCAAALYDVATAFQSANRLGEIPQVAAKLADLTAIHVAAARVLYGYDSSNPTDAAQGAMAQPLAQALVQNMRDYVASGATLRFRQYASNGAEIAALLALFGDQSDSAFATVFGDAVMVELLKNKADGSYSVQVLRAAPTSQVPSAQGFTYAQQAPQVKCLAAAATAPYDAASGICPLDDFARYVDATKAQQASGWCALPTSEFTALDCGTTTAAPKNEYCRRYRTLCPSVSCAKGYILNAANLECARVPSLDECSAYKVVFSQVVHRHGARSPLVSANQTEICGLEYPCGYLNEEGQEMLYAVGEYVRERYNNISIVDDYFFPGNKYNASLVYSRSTAYERTLQSSAAFLSGLFPDETVFYPVVFSVNKTTDFLLHMGSNPVDMLRYNYNFDGQAAYLDPIVDSYFTFEQLQEMAAEVFYSGGCADFAKRYLCALDLYDIAYSFQVQGKLGDKPNIAAGFQQLEHINEAGMVYLYSWNASTVLQREEGSLGQAVAQKLISNMYDYIESPTYRMFEYSGHDTTVCPLGVTLGDQSYETFQSLYGTTLLIELLERSDKQRFVRVLRGNPQRDAEGKYNYVDTGFAQHCIDSNGDMYLAEDNICPLEDFVRMVDYSKPSVPHGECIVNQTLYDRMHCPETIESGGYMSSDCVVFRIACPYNSCPEGYIVNSADYQCYPTTYGQSSSSSSTTTTTTTAAPTPTPTPAPNPTPTRQPVTAQRPARVEQRRRVARQLAMGVSTGVVIGAAVPKY